MRAYCVCVCMGGWVSGWVGGWVEIMPVFPSGLEVAVRGKESVEEERNVAQAVASELREKLDAAEDDLREVCGCV